MSTEEDQKRVINYADEHKEFVELEDGFIYWSPRGSTHGVIQSYQLRWIADELDKRNKDWKEQLDKIFDEKERGV